jgi:hypothetical protein
MAMSQDIVTSFVASIPGYCDTRSAQTANSAILRNNTCGWRAARTAASALMAYGQNIGIVFPREVTPLDRRRFDLSSALLSPILSVKSDDKG